MGVKRLLLRGGTAAENDAYTGRPGEITADMDNMRLRVHDGTTRGGEPLARDDELPVRMDELPLDDFHSRTSLTRLSQLEADVEFWKRNELTRVSQLENDAGYVAGHCTYCEHCTYCTDC